MNYLKRLLKTGLLVIIILLFSSKGFAQITISESEFNHFVDYANCLYLKTFIEEVEIGNQSNHSEIKDYIEQASLDSPEEILYEKLINLLSNYDSARKLAEAINKRKTKYESFSDNESLIKSLNAEIWENVDLKPTAEIIIQNINSKLSEIRSNNEEELQTNNDDVNQNSNPPINNTSELNDAAFLDKKNIFEENSNMILYTILALNLLFSFVLLFKISSLSKNKNSINSDKIIQKVLNDDKLLDLIRTNVPKRTEDLSGVLKSIKELVNRIEDLEKTHTHIKPTIIEPTQKNDRFLKGKKENTFSRVESSSEGSYFKLINENNGFAEFEFCAKIEEVRNIINPVFDNVSDFSGSIQNATSIKTLERGKIKFENGRWEVTQKTKIKFI